MPSHVSSQVTHSENSLGFGYVSGEGVLVSPILWKWKSRLSGVQFLPILQIAKIAWKVVSVTSNPGCIWCTTLLL